MNEDRMNGVMDAIRHEPLSVRQLSTLTMIPSMVVQKYIDLLVSQNIAEVSHTRKLKMSTVTYYRLIDRTKRF